MKLFGQIIRTVVNTAVLPVAIAKDAHAILIGERPEHLTEAVERLKEEADPTPPSRQET